ncbi:MAG: hypothetical protein ACYDBB_11265 [Armatimonadota bacterium]
MHRPTSPRLRSLLGTFTCCAAFLLASVTAWGQDSTDKRLDALEQRLQTLEQQETAPASPASSKLTLGGYGEIHVNAVEGSGSDQIDIHRAVLYLGYDFTDWIRLNSEVEIEHAFVLKGNGEISIEQLYLDFAGTERLNARAGRVLMPIGLINQRHEPTTFNGVERPLVDRVIIPTTWFADGAGIYGTLSPHLKYEAYLSNSLDAAGFSALDGIRNGRMKERPGLHQLAVSGRLDYFPFATADLKTPQNLRVGLAFFNGGANNGNKGATNDLDAGVAMYAADAEYTIGKLDLRGELAYGRIHGAQAIGNNVASAIMGWYAEAGVHVLPARWKTGKLKEADAVLFVRHERADTQYRMPVGVNKDPAGDQTETTVGLSFFPVSSLVVKADYQFRGDATGADVPNQFNLGIGWAF